MRSTRNGVGPARKRLQAVAYLVLVIFAIQMHVAIVAAIPPEPMPPVPPPASPPTEFAFLNHTQIMEDADGC